MFAYQLYSIPIGLAGIFWLGYFRQGREPFILATFVRVSGAAHDFFHMSAFIVALVEDGRPGLSAWMWDRVP